MLCSRLVSCGSLLVKRFSIIPSRLNSTDWGEKYNKKMEILKIMHDDLIKSTPEAIQIFKNLAEHQVSWETTLAELDAAKHKMAKMEKDLIELEKNKKTVAECQASWENTLTELRAAKLQIEIMEKDQIEHGKNKKFIRRDVVKEALVDCINYYEDSLDALGECSFWGNYRKYSSQWKQLPEDLKDEIEEAIRCEAKAYRIEVDTIKLHSKLSKDGTIAIHDVEIDSLVLVKFPIFSTKKIEVHSKAQKSGYVTQKDKIMDG